MVCPDCPNSVCVGVNCTLAQEAFEVIVKAYPVLKGFGYEKQATNGAGNAARSPNCTGGPSESVEER